MVETRLNFYLIPPTNNYPRYKSVEWTAADKKVENEKGGEEKRHIEEDTRVYICVISV